ncbi:NAD-glutamate dehydrogenase [Mesorhizobium microcysteis]|uniref:NAD-glutamate dehydrogenase n=1 Tax=Neoaquamicrobium microcysteis TaxID=2682781 RepID=A0A5D4H1D9_9HYPH|nr:NAD-glutamate dehydrogenase [Mesorhizobium microcysteis]TYR34102.1 NAD-glutamate dehydrogenase [Mesorhizobium microcysteis]
MAAAKKKPTAGKSNAAEVEKLAAFLKARAPAEDIADYEASSFNKAVQFAHAALKSHKRGDSVIAIDEDPALVLHGRPVTAITVVNDNMPFLFDSITGEIADSAGEASLVLHPVILVKHDKTGVAELFGDGSAGKSDPQADRVSLIHVHVGRLGPEAAKALKARLSHVVAQVRAAVADWKPMLARLDEAIHDFRFAPIQLDKGEVTEAIAFLEWLRDDNFTFLGMREFKYTGGEQSGTLERTRKAGLGILSDPDVKVLRRGTEPVTTTPEIRAFLHGPDPLIVTKANAKSVVHRRIYLDYVGVKTFDAKGRLTGELRIVGLFTSTAYTRSVMKIPYLRSKANAVIAKSGFDPNDHSGKALINVLESYPRDELFQISVPILRKHAEAILALGERPRVRVLFRVDQFDRFVSVIVFVPRDRYDSNVRERIGAFLKTVFDGRLSAYYPAFPEGSLARVHFIIGRSDGKTPRVETAALEAGLRSIVRTWDDALREAASDAQAAPALVAVAQRLPQSYRNSFTPETALRDAGHIAGISADNPIAIDFYHLQDHDPSGAALKIYHHGQPVALSRRVPLLENMGFRVISERTFEIEGEEGAGAVFVHDMELVNGFGQPIDLSDGGALLEEVFLSAWRGETDNDGYAALVQTAGLGARQIQLLRAYGRYLQQAGIPQSQDFIAAVLNRYPDIARALFQLFAARFDPAARKEGEVTATHLKAAIKDALDEVPNLDDDTILRRYQNLIDSSLRTNYYAVETDKPRSLAIKLDSRAVTGLPEPRPWREIFVYGPEVEGVHLRFGAVARGGLRWSDRAQDYRTEVLGLVKAQQVKNAVIVPVGAKGGFYPRLLPAGGSRSEIFEAGRKAYINFISSMLSITDNLDGDKVVPPAGVIRRDVDDPYFVVAADKGTATFSDTANAISQDHGFWLDDAFASGGSAGYDHKKMGITARGAWEAVKRHFREMNRDIQTEPFTVVGVGDMSGDVFGNGMLLSPCIRLVAAFDHRDIFIDPTPDEASSLAERQRLFDNPQLNWQDYDKSLLSEGGMVIPRSSKSVTLTPQAAEAIGLEKTTASPAEIMNAILKAHVDLLWFGGIGTYVRGAGEANAEVGDRANDAIRITGSQIGAKVVGEGANLGMTQRARIEYGLAGGRCNSDAIDNSAGVNSSDVEVNIKIALASAMRKGSLSRPARNKLLAEMTEEVAALVLANNYQQTLSLSLTRRRGLADLPHQERFMQALEGRGLLDRAVEVLPGSAAIAEREARGEPLTRAEIGVLLAYAKIVLFDDIVASGLPDDPHFDTDLKAYFPGRMAKKYAAEIEAHRLRREIVATVLGNDAINRGGPSFITRMQDLTGCAAAEVVAAYTVVRDGFELPALYAEIDALDNKVDGDVQLDLYQSVGRLVHSATAWFLKNDDNTAPLGARISSLRAARKALEGRIGTMLPAFTAERLEERTHELFKTGAPEVLAQRVSFLSVAELIPDIAGVAEEAKAALVDAARAFFAITDAFRIGRISDAARSIQPTDYYDGLALSRATETISEARRGMAIAALSAYGKQADPVAAWLEAGGDKVARARDRLQALTEGGELTVSRLTVASGLMSDLS